LRHETATTVWTKINWNGASLVYFLLDLGSNKCFVIETFITSVKKPSWLIVNCLTQAAASSLVKTLSILLSGVAGIVAVFIAVCIKVWTRVNFVKMCPFQARTSSVHISTTNRPNIMIASCSSVAPQHFYHPKVSITNPFFLQPCGYNPGSAAMNIEKSEILSLYNSIDTCITARPIEKMQREWGDSTNPYLPWIIPPPWSPALSKSIARSCFGSPLPSYVPLFTRALRSYRRIL